MHKVHLVNGHVVYVYWIDTVYVQNNLPTEEAIAISRVFYLVDMITNTKFSNCTLDFKIGEVRQLIMQRKHQKTFQSHLSLAKQ